MSDNASYSGSSSRFLQLLNVPSLWYGYQYICLIDGTSYSNTLTLKFTSHWKGRNNKTWEHPANWSCCNVPHENTDVVILTNNNTPEVNSNVSCRSLTVNNGAVVTVKPGFELKVMK